MKPDSKNLDSHLDRLLSLFNAVSPDQFDASCERMRRRLNTEGNPGAPAMVAELPPVRHAARFVFAGAIAAAALVVAMVLTWPHRAFVETVGGGLYRVSGETTQPLTGGETIRVGDVLRTKEGASAIVSLADGSRVEMHSQTEFSLEYAEDGIRIHLIGGGVIVNAAKQLAGHLYVQTKDVIVSVVGTVFLVNAEEDGSRVAVIEGEVRVQQGATSKNLLPGEQLSTSPRMVSPPVKEEISWSRNAETHVALLRQATVVPGTSAPQSPPQARLAFEEVSVRSANPGEAVGGRGGPQPMCSRRVQIDAGRFVVTGTTLYGLVALAFGKDCSVAYETETLSGGPSWITSKSDRFNIQALLPEGTSSYTSKQFLNGEAPKLQMLLQALLADRFKLEVRRETKEMTIYVLTVAKSGPKLKAWKDGDPDGFGALARQIEANKASMADLAAMLARLTRRPVLDRTNLPGEYTFAIAFAPFDNRPGSSGPSLFTALEDDMGLKLDVAKETVEILRIEHVERPSEN